MRGGYFISFEGLDGSGKTTQLQRLAQQLTEAGHAVTVLRQPGSTALGDRIRSVLLDSRSERSVGAIAPMAELALMFADRAQAVAEVIAPALAAGHVVLCDRFTDSSEAYQGGGRGLGSAAVLELHHAVCGELQPDLTFLLLPPLGAALRRARRRNQRHIERAGTDENRFEREPDEFYGRIDAAYRRIAKREPDRVVPIESAGTVDEINRTIHRITVERLAARVELP